MNTYHFSCGNSSEGPVGLCARVAANTKIEALMKLRRALESSTGALGQLTVPVTEPDIEYINVYISPEHIGLADVERF